MQSGFFLLRAVGVAVALLCLTFLTLSDRATRNTAAKPALTRTADRHAELQRLYVTSTMTPWERQPADPPFLTKAETDDLQKAEAARRTKDNMLTTSEPKSFFE